MEIINNILINTLQVLSPFLLYFFYVAYKNIDDERENDLAIIITIFSSIYICLKYNETLIEGFPLILINVPLLISYYKKNNIAVMSSSIIIILYMYKFYNSFLIIFILEYIILYLIYFILKNKNILILIFTIINIVTTFIIITITNPNIILYLNALILGIIFYIITTLIIYFLKKAENILEIHNQIKEIEKEKQIRTMLFKITHEIKNPLAVCKGYLDMFDVNNKNHAKKYIPIMKEEIDKTLILLEDFLSMNKLKLKKDVLDINYLLEEVVESFKMFWKEKHIETNINIQNEEVYINGDYNRLRQVFLNIIKNSMEALKENPKIEIESKTKENKIYITIKDNGKGISKNILEKIKEPFFTTKEKGTGLGVPLSYEIIEAHNGKINYKSKENEFTKVTIELPILNI